MLTVVTGATGHVGGNLIRALLAEGRTVRAVVYGTDTRAIDGLPIERVEGSVFDEESLVKAFTGAEVVYHLAALISITGSQNGLVRKTNVEGVEHVVSACKRAGVRRLVHVSSIHAHDISDQSRLDEPVDETRTFTDENGPAYDHSKALGQKVVLRAVNEDGLDAVIVNPTGIVGPNDFAPSHMGETLLALSRGTLPGIVEGGFNWVDVRDVAAGAMLAEKKGKVGEAYLLTGHYVPVKDLAKTVEKETGVKAPWFVTPMWLARLVAPFALFFARLLGKRALFTPESLNALRANKQLLHDKATRELGYNPRPFEVTIHDTIAWFREHGDLPQR